MKKKKIDREKLKKVLAVVLVVLCFLATVGFCFQITTSAVDSPSTYASGDLCLHKFDGSKCIKCGYICTHATINKGLCTSCKTYLPQYCPHSNYASGKCIACGYTCPHNSGFTPAYPSKCKTCGLACTHPSYSGGKCTSCGLACTHPSYSGGKCTSCGYSCRHSNYASGKCIACGYTCPHNSGFTPDYPSKCKTCGLACTHPSYSGGKCTSCGYSCPHPNKVYNVIGVSTHSANCPDCSLTLSAEAHVLTYADNHKVYCSKCAYVLKDGYTTKDVFFFSGTPTVKSYSNTSGLTTLLSPTYEDGVVYYHADKDVKRGSLSFSFGEVTLKRYIFIKYRIIPCEEIGYLALKLKYGSTYVDVGGVNYATTDAQWRVVLIDLVSLGRGGQAQQYTSLTLAFEHVTPLDISYIASADSVASLRTLLADNELYYYGASRFISSKTEFQIYDKDGNLTYCPHNNVEYSYKDDSLAHFKYCVDCNEVFPSEYHTFGDDYYCTSCGYSCPHATYSGGKCTSCGSSCSLHVWQGSKCKTCGLECFHVDGYTNTDPYSCNLCGSPCTHDNVVRSYCTSCGAYVEVPAIVIEGGFISLFSSIYDAQANTFFSLLGYEILGINIATLLVSIVALGIVVFVLKKVI